MRTALAGYGAGRRAGVHRVCLRGICHDALSLGMQLLPLQKLSPALLVDGVVDPNHGRHILLLWLPTLSQHGIVEHLRRRVLPLLGSYAVDVRHVRGEEIVRGPRMRVKLITTKHNAPSWDGGSQTDHPPLSWCTGLTSPFGIEDMTRCWLRSTRCPTAGCCLSSISI